MKGNKINSENYESFYLDYLEGNLGEMDSLELFAFLNENPQFQVDDELTTLEPASMSLGHDFKNLLKTDAYSQAISFNNVDLFLIAEKEGQLNQEQSSSLGTFLMLHPELETDQKLYTAATLKADESIVYTDKGGLKQKGKIILWPYFSAAAAACAVLLLWMLPSNHNPLAALSAAQDLEYKTRQIQVKGNSDGETVDEIKTHTIQPIKTYQAVQKAPTLEAPNRFVIVPKKQELAVNIKKTEPSQPVIRNPKLKEVEDQPLKSNGIALKPVPENKDKDHPAMAMNSGMGLSMKDVAPPITRKLSEMIKTEVNLKKGQDTQGKREGVLLKVGKFEYYRNKKLKQ